MYDIRFPNLGIVLKNIKDGFTIFGFEIKFYGVIIALGFVLAFLVISKEAKRTGQSEDTYLDFMLWLIIPAILGARLYYIIFSWDSYFQKGKGFGKTLFDLIDIRSGGLAIYGGVIAGVIVAIVFAKKQKMKFSVLADTVTMGLLIGQIMGRWGNFFNREAFGDYTNSLFAMAIPTDYYVGKGTLTGMINSGIITSEMANHMQVYDGMQWITVHPTFLYESIWCFCLFWFLLWFDDHKRSFDGQMISLYMILYSVERFFVEGLRTDSLMVGPLRQAQLISLSLIAAGIALYVFFKKRTGRYLP